MITLEVKRQNTQIKRIKLDFKKKIHLYAVYKRCIYF